MCSSWQETVHFVAKNYTFSVAEKCVLYFTIHKDLRKVNGKQKQNVHISVVPMTQEETGNDRMKFVRWKLYGIKSFDLKDETDYKDLCTYTRPFTMSEQYTRQIANAMIAHFSRAGVDELFMKAERSLQAVFST